MLRFFLEVVKVGEQLLQGKDLFIAQAEEVLFHDVRIEHLLRQMTDDVLLAHAVAHLDAFLLGNREQFFLGEACEHVAKRRRHALFVLRILQALVKDRGEESLLRFRCGVRPLDGANFVLVGGKAVSPRLHILVQLCQRAVLVAPSVKAAPKGEFLVHGVHIVADAISCIFHAVEYCCRRAHTVPFEHLRRPAAPRLDNLFQMHVVAHLASICVEVKKGARTFQMAADLHHGSFFQALAMRLLFRQFGDDHLLVRQQEGEHRFLLPTHR